MVGILNLAPHHDSLQYIHHVHLMQWGQNWGVTHEFAKSIGKDKNGWKEKAHYNQCRM